MINSDKQIQPIAFLFKSNCLTVRFIDIGKNISPYILIDYKKTRVQS